MNSLIYNFESVHPYDDAAVRYGTILIRTMGGGGIGSIDNIGSSDSSVSYVLDQIDLYNCDLHYELVINSVCQIKSKFLTDLPATRFIGMLLTRIYGYV